MADQNLQAAQAAAVLNQSPPPPPQNPDEPPANPQNAAAEEVTLDLCLFFFVLSLFCFATRVVFIAAFSSFSSRVVMPCFVTYSFIVTVLRTKLNFLSGFFFAVHILRLFLLRPMLNCTVHFLPCLKTCCFVALEAILDYTTSTFEGNSSLFPAGVMPCFTILFYFSHCSFPF